MGHKLGSHFHVELKAVRHRPITKRLMRAEFAAGQMNGSRGQVEVSPCHWNTVSVAAQRRTTGQRRPTARPRSVPADLLDAIRVDLLAQSLGQQLRPQANAQDRYLSFDSLSHSVQFRLKERIFLGIIRTHRPAEDDQARGLFHRQPRRHVGKEIEVRARPASLRLRNRPRNQRAVRRVVQDGESVA